MRHQVILAPHSYACFTRDLPCFSGTAAISDGPLVPLQIRLLTTQHSSADTIRLWLERSGESVPLDIEIFLRVARPGSEATPPCPRRVASSPLLAPITPPWNTSSHQQVAPQYMIPHAPPPASVANVTIVMPPSPPSHQDSWSTGGNTSHGHDRSPNAISRSSMHWGHIAFFYLVEQMHRWERFIFRFDKQFTSMGALKAINGEVLLLKIIFAAVILCILTRGRASIEGI